MSWGWHIGKVWGVAWVSVPSIPSSAAHLAQILGEALPASVTGCAHDTEVNRMGLGLVPGAKLWVKGLVVGF